MHYYLETQLEFHFGSLFCGLEKMNFTPAVCNLAGKRDLTVCSRAEVSDNGGWEGSLGGDGTA